METCLTSSIKIFFKIFHI